MSRNCSIHEDPERIVVITEAYFTIGQVAKMLRRRPQTIRELAASGDDPIPFRIFATQARGPLVYGEDLYCWWHRNTIPYCESEQSSTNDTSYKRTSHGAR